MKALKIILYFLILRFCLGQFGRFPFFVSYANVYIWDLLAIGLVGCWLVYKWGIEKKMELPPKWLPVFVFSFVAFLSLINGLRWIDVGEGVVAAGYWVRWVVYSGVYFVAYDLFKKDPSVRNQAVNILITAGVILAVLGFVQLAVFPDLSQLDPDRGWDPHKNRMVSTWLDPNFLGAYFVLCLSLLLSKLVKFGDSSKDFRGTGKGFSRIILLIVASFLLSVGLLLTFSRSAWGMLAVVLGVFGVLKSRKLLFLVALVSFSAYFFVPRVQTRITGITDPADSASKRLESWERTWEIIKEYPVLGVGFNAFRYAQERAGYFRTERGVPIESGHSGAGSDSSILLVWATTGVIGLLSYLWLYGSIIWQALTKVLADSPKPGFKSSPKARLFSSASTLEVSENQKIGSRQYARKALSLSVLAVLAGLLMESNFINSLFFSPIVISIWVLVAAVEI